MTKYVKVPITVDASGNAVVYSSRVSGKIAQIDYVPDGTNPLATGADVTITTERTGAPVVTLTNIGLTAFTKAPRMPTHAVADGSALLYAAGGTAVTDKVGLANDRIKFSVAQGGNALKGTFYVLLD